MGFAFAEGQTIFLFQFLADTDIPFQPVAVGDSFTVVVHTVEDNEYGSITNVSTSYPPRSILLIAFSSWLCALPMRYFFISKNPKHIS